MTNQASITDAEIAATRKRGLESSVGQAHAIAARTDESGVGWAGSKNAACSMKHQLNAADRLMNC